MEPYPHNSLCTIMYLSCIIQFCRLDKAICWVDKGKFAQTSSSFSRTHVDLLSCILSVARTHSFLRRVNKKNKNKVSAKALAALFHKALAKSLFQRLRDFPLTMAVTGSHTTSRFRKTIDGLSALFMKTLELKWSWKRTKCATFLHGFCQRQNSSQQGRCRYLLVHWKAIPSRGCAEHRFFKKAEVDLMHNFMNILNQSRIWRFKEERCTLMKIGLPPQRNAHFQYNNSLHLNQLNDEHLGVHQDGPEIGGCVSPILLMIKASLFLGQIPL